MKRWILPTFLMFIVDVAAAHSPGNPRVPTFRAEPSWPAIPNNWVFGEVSSIVVDSQDHGNIYTAEIGRGRRAQKLTFSGFSSSPPAR